MCGCPVVASSVGGLQDLVVDGWTGIRFEPGNSCALAAVLLAFLRSPALPRWLGQNAENWAQQNFETRSVYADFEHLLEHPSGFRTKEPMDCGALYRKQVIDRILPSLEKIVGRSSCAITDLTSSPAITAGLSFDDGTRAFLKVYPPRPSFFATLHPPQTWCQESTVGKERLELLLLLEHSDLIPKILASDVLHGFVLQEWTPTKRFASADAEFHHAKVMAGIINAAEPSLSTDNAKEGLLSVMERIMDSGSALTLEDVDAFDRAAASLNSSLLGGRSSCRRVHPQVELKKLETFLLGNFGWLPPNYRIRALAEAHFLFGATRFIPAIPKFCHGTLKAEHLLEDRKLCDLDHAGYYCGPVDVAHTVWEHFRGEEGIRPKKIAEWLGILLPDPDDFVLGVFWVLAFQLSRDLIRLSQGKWNELQGSVAFLYRWKEALRDSKFTQLGESADLSPT